MRGNTYNIELPKLHRNFVRIAGLPADAHLVSLTHESGQSVVIEAFNGSTEMGIEEKGKLSFWGPPGEYSVDFIDARPKSFSDLHRHPMRFTWPWTEKENAQPTWGRFNIPEGGSEEVHLATLDTREVTFVLTFRGETVQTPLVLASPRGYVFGVRSSGLQRPYRTVQIVDNVLLPPGNYEVTTTYPRSVVGCVNVK